MVAPVKSKASPSVVDPAKPGKVGGVNSQPEDSTESTVSSLVIKKGP